MIKLLIMKAVLRFPLFILVITLLIHISCKKEYSCENCGTTPPQNGTNKPPIAVAGPDQTITLPADSVSLDGNASTDPDGIISEWLWTKLSGPASFSIINVTAIRTIVKNLTVGIYQFELLADDDYFLGFPVGLSQGSFSSIDTPSS